MDTIGSPSPSQLRTPIFSLAACTLAVFPAVLSTNIGPRFGCCSRHQHHGHLPLLASSLLTQLLPSKPAWYSQMFHCALSITTQPTVGRSRKGTSLSNGMFAQPPKSSHITSWPMHRTPFPGRYANFYWPVLSPTQVVSGTPTPHRSSQRLDSLRPGAWTTKPSLRNRRHRYLSERTGRSSPWHATGRDNRSGQVDGSPNDRWNVGGQTRNGTQYLGCGQCRRHPSPRWTNSLDCVHRDRACLLVSILAT